MGRLRSNLPSMQGVPAGTYVLPNTRAVTDNLVLEVAAGDFYNLTDPLTVTDAVVTYANITFVDDLLIKIEDEILRVTDVTGDDVTFARAQLGTSAARHVPGLDIYVEDFNDTTADTANSDFDNTTDPLIISTAVTDYPAITFAVDAVLLIESEKIRVAFLDEDGDAVQFMRGYLGTTTAAHADANSIFLLEWADSTDDTAGTGIQPIASDEFRTAPYSGYLVKRSQNDDENDVDWSGLESLTFYWTGTIVTSNGRHTITQEPTTFFDEIAPASPIDVDGAINLELAYQAIVDTLLAAGGAFSVDERGWAFGDPPPTYDESTETYTGTGILGHTPGIVGVVSDVLQFQLDDTGLALLDDAKLGLGVAVADMEANTRFHIYESGASNEAGLLVEDVSDTQHGGLKFKRARAGLTATQSGDILGSLVAKGYTGSAYVSAPQTFIKFGVSQNTTASNQGSFISFETTPNGSTAASGRVEIIRMMQNGALGIGVTSVTSGYGVESDESVFVNSSSSNSGFVARYTGASSASVGPQNGFMTNDGAAMASSDRLGALLFGGYDGGAEANQAAIIAQANQAWSAASARGTKIAFYTTPNGSTTLTLALLIGHDQILEPQGGLRLLDGTNILLQTTTGTKIGTATTQKLGFFNATPIVQPGATTDLGTVLSDLGLRASGTAYPLTTSGAVQITGTNPFGYGTGAGGTVTQNTNKSTGVTLNKTVGTITMNNAALAGDTTVTFTLTNSTIGATDLVLLNHTSAGTAGAYLLNAQVAAGSATINVRNITTGSLSEAIVIRFAVIKGVTA